MFGAGAYFALVFPKTMQAKRASGKASEEDVQRFKFARPLGYLLMVIALLLAASELVA